MDKEKVVIGAVAIFIIALLLMAFRGVLISEPTGLEPLDYQDDFSIRVTPTSNDNHYNFTFPSFSLYNTSLLDQKGIDYTTSSANGTEYITVYRNLTLRYSFSQTGSIEYEDRSSEIESFMFYIQTNSMDISVVLEYTTGEVSQGVRGCQTDYRSQNMGLNSTGWYDVDLNSQRICA